MYLNFDMVVFMFEINWKNLVEISLATPEEKKLGNF